MVVMMVVMMDKQRVAKKADMMVAMLVVKMVAQRDVVMVVKKAE